MLWTNGLAYLASSLVTEKKGFMTLTPEGVAKVYQATFQKFLTMSRLKNIHFDGIKLVRLSMSDNFYLG